MENMAKMKRIKDEQEELSRQNLERKKKQQNLGIEKLKDKEMIDKKIEEMKGLEASYREFYEKRMKNLDQKMKSFQPIMESNLHKQELINKRNEE
jgi:hypothetical protein